MQFDEVRDELRARGYLRASSDEANIYDIYYKSKHADTKVTLLSPLLQGEIFRLIMGGILRMAANELQSATTLEFRYNFSGKDPHAII